VNLAEGGVTGSAGPLGLLIVLLLAISTVLLIRNMNKRLKRLPTSFEEPSRPDESDDSASGPIAGP
jgi:hypothetical protein